ncbi:MAG: aldo/keto reductase [Candidatus Hydrogenedens sp.]|jgi:methylglyoxal reductase|nr:aldo/keto reductase [Candidatus Hydrogenedens sp.]
MQFKTLGNSGINASVIAIGTWVTGGGESWGGVDDTESIRAIDAALDRGINFIDTAASYGWGHAEEVLGKALKDKRDQVILATKCGIWWQDARGSFHYHLDGKDTYISLRPDTIQIEVENSLRRLQTDYIDLYQVHWPAKEPENTPIAETMACLLKLKEEGKIRSIGVSNVSLDELESYCGCGDIASDQFRYSMLYREPEENILPYCEKNGLSTLTYMSLEQGLLTGKVGMDRSFKEGEFRTNTDWNPWFKLENRPKVLAMLEGWTDLTAKYECTLAQLVIAWTLAQPGVTHILCGMRTVAQAEDNSGAGNIQLDPADVARIRQDALALGDPQ